MSTNRAENEARQYLDAVSRHSVTVPASGDYDRALRKATASFTQLQEAVRLAEINSQSSNS
jgi:hypothetical protein